MNYRFAIAIVALAVTVLVGCDHSTHIPEAMETTIRIRDIEKILNNYTASRAIEPRSIDLGDRHLLYIPDVKTINNNVQVTYTFYEYSEGKLVRVNLSETK